MRERSEPYDYMPYLKFFSRPWLLGSMRHECSVAERGVFVDLLAMANESRNRGVIQANEQMAYKHEWLANFLNIPLDLFEHCLKKFQETGRIYENETGIKIINFEWYQGILGEPRGRGRPRKRPNQLSMADPETIKKQNEYNSHCRQRWKELEKEYEGKPPPELWTQERERIHKEIFGYGIYEKPPE